MNRAILPLLSFGLLLASCAKAPADDRRGGIVSLNPCADQLMIELVPPERIRAISHYSKLPGSASIPADVAKRFESTAGTAEEVIALNPDHVIASIFTPATTRAAFARAGLNAIYLGAPTNIADSQAQISELAQFLDAAPAGSRLNQRIDRAVSAAKAKLTNPAIPTLFYISGDLVNGSGTLLDELMSLSGLSNAAGDYGLKFTGTLPLETILANPPALILTPDSGGRTAALRGQLLARMNNPPRHAEIDPSLTHCGGPTIPAALERLRAIHAEAVQ